MKIIEPRNNISLLDPYIPGYQPPHSEDVVKLNTNENPYPPSSRVMESISGHNLHNLRLYPDSFSGPLRKKIAEVYKMQENQIFCGNGSDEIISLVLRTFFEHDEAVLFPYPTYSYYKTQAEIHDCRYKFIDTDGDFNIELDRFLGLPAKGVFIANPNAPTGRLLPCSTIEEFIEKFQGLVVVDEAYIDFGGEDESAVRLVSKYDNLIVLRTFSKSFSLCGIRVGYAFADPKLIQHLDNARDSYNVSLLSQVAAAAAMDDIAYMRENASKIIEQREWLRNKLAGMGFSVIPSSGNFLFVRHQSRPAGEIYRALVERNIFVRYFSDRCVCEYLRITIGTSEQLQRLVDLLKEIL